MSWLGHPACEIRRAFALRTKQHALESESFQTSFTRAHISLSLRQFALRLGLIT